MRIGDTELKEDGLTIIAERPGFGEGKVSLALMEDVLRNHKLDGEVALFILDYRNFYGRYSYYSFWEDHVKTSPWMSFSKMHPEVNLVFDDALKLPATMARILERLRAETPVKYIFIDTVCPLNCEMHKLTRASMLPDQTTTAAFLEDLAAKNHVSIIARFGVDRRLERREDKHPQLRDLKIKDQELSRASSIILVFRRSLYEGPCPSGNEFELSIMCSSKRDTKILL